MNDALRSYPPTAKWQNNNNIHIKSSDPISFKIIRNRTKPTHQLYNESEVWRKCLLVLTFKTESMDDNPNIHAPHSAAVQILLWPLKKVTTGACTSYFLIHTSTVTSEATWESLLNEFHKRTQIWKLILARYGRKSKYVQYHVLSNSSESRGSSLTSAVETGGSPSNCGK